MIASTTIRIELGIGYVLLLPLWIGVIGLLTGRVLGVHIGRWRTFIAAAVGWLIGLVGGAIALGQSHPHPALIIPLSVFFGVLAALPVAIALDMVTHGRPGSHGTLRRAVRHPVRWMKSVLSPIGRFRELVGNARRENLLHVRYRNPAALASPDMARRVRLVLERSGGMFVKFGQIAATRSDLLPETLTSELSSLHSNVARLRPEEVQEVLGTELGEPVQQAFASFSVEPLAAASIGQTHRASLHDGRAVIVKIQRPGIDDIVRRDSAVLSVVARQLDRRVEAAHRVGIRDLADELITSIKAELDYGREVAAGLRLAQGHGANGAVRIPVVHPTLSSGRMLVMDEVVGRSVSDDAAVDAAPVERAELSRRLLGSFLDQILRDGYYHADPHPGNVLIDAEGTLWLLDFGAVGQIDPVTRDALQGIAAGLSLKDASVLARAVRYLVGDNEIDMRQLERDLSILLGEVETGGLSPAAMLGVMDVMKQHGLRPPRSMLLLSRTLLTLDGTLKTIDRKFALATEAQDLVSRDRYDALGTPEEVIRRELIHAMPALRTLPEHAETLAGQLRAGRLVLRTERYAGSDQAVIERWLNRVLVVVAGGAGALISAVMLVAGSLSPDVVVRDTMWSLGFVGLTCGTVLLLRTVAQALHAQTASRD
ncbi:MAG TPA: AarF/UbiB family protein [Solirubrobacteraceae bacterium]|nr:AarF/UbiB family protein [Solirubrobacteraceae bacterium]